MCLRKLRSWRDKDEPEDNGEGDKPLNDNNSDEENAPITNTTTGTTEVKMFSMLSKFFDGVVHRCSPSKVTVSNRSISFIFMTDFYERLPYNGLTAFVVIKF